MNRFFTIILIAGFLGLHSQVKINWQLWSEKAFTNAKAQAKPVFLDVGTEWCTACNLMEEKTYADTTVIGIINRNFIAIKADAEAQPDVGARFLEWGWPALIFLNAEGEQLYALQGNRRPEVFIEILQDFLSKYSKNDLKIQNNDFFSSEPPDRSGLKEIYKKAYDQLDYYYDSLYYGWGYALKIPLYQPVELSFWLNKSKKDQKELNKALNSLKQYSKVSDRIAGGVYFGCSSGRSWKGAQPEKRTEYQAGVMHNYAEAYQVTGNVLWLKEALLIKKYLIKSMYSKQDSLFYNSQEEYIDLKDLSKVIEPEEYFKLPESEREKYGTPPIDKTLYTDINFRLVKAFLKLYEANGDSTDLKMAVQTAEQICKKALLTEGWFKTVIANKNQTIRMREIPSDSSKQTVMYLKANAHAALSMLQLFQFTQDSSWIYKCRKLKDIVNARLQDTLNGGYFSTEQMSFSGGGKFASTKVLNENAVFSRFLIEYGDLTDDDSSLVMAEMALRSVAVEKILGNEERLIGDFVLAMDKLIKHHFVFTIVSSSPNSTETRSLFRVVRTTYHPAKLMKIEMPGHYPDMGRPVLFICNKNLCSMPIYFDQFTKQEIQNFIRKVK